MSFWTRIGVVAVAAFVLLAGGYWLKGLVEEAGQADLLRQQIRANVDRQDVLNSRAQAAEAKLLTERQKSANLRKQWSKIREYENRTVCPLDDDTIGLLRDATRPAGFPAR